MTDHQQDTALPAGLDHRFSFGHREGHRFFNEHVFPGFRRKEGLRAVPAVGRGDEDSIHLGVSDQVSGMFEGKGNSSLFGRRCGRARGPFLEGDAGGIGTRP